MVQFLTLDEALESHAEQKAEYGGSDGVRDTGLLESALAQPQAMFGGQYLHTDLFEMAAAYLFHLVQNHPFVDGNKRIGLEAALLFLEINGRSVETWTTRWWTWSCELPQGSPASRRLPNSFGLMRTNPCLFALPSCARLASLRQP